MKEGIGLHSSFEDIYENREAFPHVYERIGALAQIPAEKPAPEPISAQQVAIAERISLPSPDQLVEEAKKAWKIKEVPAPPDALFEALERAGRKGFRFEPRYYHEITFKKNSRFPGKGIIPGDWFWQNIKDGNIDQEAAHLLGRWVLIDPTPKPNYNGGTQMYEGDQRLGQMLSLARSQGRIKITDLTKHIPHDSRFGVSWDEIDQIIVPEVAALLQVERHQVSVPKEIEFNVAGNLYHPQWGQTSTWEWMADRFGHGLRLIGGLSGRGGLASVHYDASGNHYDLIGFRLRVAFPPKST